MKVPSGSETVKTTRHLLRALSIAVFASVAVSIAYAQHPDTDKCYGGNLDACGRIVRSARTPDIEKEGALRVRMDAFLKAGACDAALKDANDLHRILSKDPRGKEFLKSLRHKFRADIYARCVKDSKKAVEEYTLAIPGFPEQGYEERAEYFLEIGEYSRAAQDFASLIGIAPSQLSARVSRAYAELKVGDLSAAMNDLRFAINEGGRNKDIPQYAYAYRGEVLLRQNNPDAALADFEKALSIDRKDPWALIGRAEILASRGDVDRAAADANAAALIDFPPRWKLESQDRVAKLHASLEGKVPRSRIEVVMPETKHVPVGRRVALVIGNSSYTNVPKLPNPVRDADMVARALRGIGFEVVTVGNDLTREQLVLALRSFAAEADTADWALVYFAGHGMEIGGINYLIPVDSRLAADRDAQYEAVSLDQVLGAVQGAKRLRLVVLDACRDNPFAPQMRRTLSTRSVTRGFGAIEPDAGTMVFYAAKHGNVALDGQGENSPFALALTKRIVQPGVEISKLFRQVRDDVFSVTERQQEPFTYGSLPGSEDFYFVSR